MKNKYEALINDLSDKELMFHLYATQLLLLTISSILGFVLFDSYSAFLDLFDWNDIRIWTVGGIAGISVVLLDVILMKILPPHFYHDGGLNRRLFQNKSILKIGIIAFMVAFSEEILFRGIIQTQLGLVVSSVVFALVHYRYLFNWFLFLNITALSFFIGYIYLLTENVLVTIFMHFLIDFLLGIMIRFTKNRESHGREGIRNE